MSQVLQNSAHADRLESPSVDRFQFGNILGHGGMATVYRAFDTVTGRDVAIKVLHGHLREHPAILSYFRQEFAIAQKLEHPHIVRIHSLIDTQDMLALVMDLHGMHDLKQHVQLNGPMSVDAVLTIATQLLSALGYTHARNIVHQDIKPHNVLWDEATGIAKLIDFGLAKLDESIALTIPELAMGTVEYSAPEQFDDFGADARADLYSLGVTLFELLSGTLPYRGMTAAGIIQMHIEAPVPDIRIFLRATPDHVADTIQRAMAKAPEDRFESAAQMSGALSGDVQSALIETAHHPEWERLKNSYNQRQDTQAKHDWNVLVIADSQFYVEAVGPLFRNVYKKHIPDAFRESLAELPLYRQTDVSRVSKNDKDYVPLVCGLSFEKAEALRHELGAHGVMSETFRWDMGEPNSRQANGWRRMQRLRKMPSYVTPLTFFFFAALSAVLVTIAQILKIPLIVLPAVLAWVVLVIRVCFSFALHQVAPPEVWSYKAVFNPENYAVQARDFSANTGMESAGLLQPRHAVTYWQLRTKRIQRGYERIVLALSEQFLEPDDHLNVATVLEHATKIAEHIARLEDRLSAQNYPMLFEQLAHLDSEIACSDDSDLASALIEQKTILRGELERIDRDREALKTLGHELVTIGAQLEG